MFIYRHQFDGLQVAFAELAVEGLQALVVTAGPAGMHNAPGQVVETVHRFGVFACHHNLPHVAINRPGELHPLLALGCDGKIGYGDVAVAGLQRRQ